MQCAVVDTVGEQSWKRAPPTDSKVYCQKIQGKWLGLMLCVGTWEKRSDEQQDQVRVQRQRERGEMRIKRRGMMEGGWRERVRQEMALSLCPLLPEPCGHTTVSLFLFHFTNCDTGSSTSVTGSITEQMLISDPSGVKRKH